MGDLGRDDPRWTPATSTPLTIEITIYGWSTGLCIESGSRPLDHHCSWGGEIKTIHMLCGSEVNEAARRLAYHVQNVIRKGPGPGEPQAERIWAYVRPRRRAFLDLVREHLE
jgi:hypothetical protein